MISGGNAMLASSPVTREVHASQPDVREVPALLVHRVEQSI